MTSEWYYIDDMDFCFDDTSESLEIMLEKLAKVAPSAFVKVNYLVGSGGGWPQGEAIVHAKDIRAFLEFFGTDESDIDWQIGTMRPIEDAAR
jgi:hypothetical protein